MSKQMSKTRVSIRLSTDVAALLDHASAGQYGGLSKIAEQAIKAYFLPEGDQRFEIMTRRIDEMQKMQRRMAEDQVVTMQAVNTFVWFYLLMTPPTPMAEDAASKALALKRYEDFLSRLGRDVRGDAHLSDLVLPEMETPEGEGA